MTDKAQPGAESCALCKGKGGYWVASTRINPLLGIPDSDWIFCVACSQRAASLAASTED